MTAHPLCAVRNLTWVPPDADAPLFDGVDLQVRRGESLGLEGRSGAGKSTLLKCLVGLEPRDGGEVYWRGEPVEGNKFREMRRDVVYVHQEPVGLAPTVGGNLAFAREMATGEGLSGERQRELLERLEVGDIDADRVFEKLSVGERQRVALVRCLTLQPTALLLDEPTASLDAESLEGVEQLLADYRARAPDERTLVWVSHAAGQLERVADRVVTIDDL